jgi:hypothetical protein
MKNLGINDGVMLIGLGSLDECLSELNKHNSV